MIANFYIFFKLLIVDYEAESKEIQLCTTVDCQSEQLFPLSVSSGHFAENHSSGKTEMP